MSDDYSFNEYLYDLDIVTIFNISKEDLFNFWSDHGENYIRYSKQNNYKFENLNR